MVLADTEDTWGRLFQEGGQRYREPTLVLFEGEVHSACGFASAATGPFYCPGDQKLYIDLVVLRRAQPPLRRAGRFRPGLCHRPRGRPPRPEPPRHPAGGRRRRGGRAARREANQLSVQLELQADCLAGVWAHDADAKGILEVGDIDEALNAASAIGDDTLQRQSQGYVVPDSFTHGTSAQRSEWFKRGYQQGSVDACDTFS